MFHSMHCLIQTVDSGDHADKCINLISFVTLRLLRAFVSQDLLTKTVFGLPRERWVRFAFSITSSFRWATLRTDARTSAASFTGRSEVREHDLK
jgi:hypothetical protein